MLTESTEITEKKDFKKNDFKKNDFKKNDFKKNDFKKNDFKKNVFKILPPYPSVLSVLSVSNSKGNKQATAARASAPPRETPQPMRLRVTCRCQRGHA